MAEAAGAAGVRRLGLEAQTVTWAQQLRWAGELFSDGELVPTERWWRSCDWSRMPARRLGSAPRARSPTLRWPRCGHGSREAPTEIEFGLELDATMRRLGAADVSFETIVASGPNGAKPHHHPSDRRIVEGDLVVIDFGALVDGYHSDMTRTVAVGDVGDERRRMLEVVLESQDAGVRAVRGRRDRRGGRRGVPLGHRRAPAGARPSCTPPVTAWGSTSTRSLGCRAGRLLPSSPATW